ncbi:unnamed protein product [Cylicostephanus goldi]|uniref:Uncharacterized protein n=1 Tax=Cylicostephanus goldi TaxID=71465 RepID=A0A3P6UCB2_CYLGO|nr:unnamed protein product [Cylicostephanus goldi]
MFFSKFIFTALIVQHYGVSSYFIATTILGFFYSSTGRGSYNTPLTPIEMLYYREIRGFLMGQEHFDQSGCYRLSRFLLYLLAEIMGGAMAWHIARTLWFHSLQYSQAHMEMFVNSQNMCSIVHQRDFLIVLAYEIAGCFAMRSVISRLPADTQKYLAPAFTASLFSFEL